MRSRVVVRIVGFVAASFLLSVVMAGEKYTLRYSMKKGEVYRYADVADTKSTQEMMGQEMKSTSLARMTSRCVVEDVTGDGTQVLVLSYDSMTVATKSPRVDTTMVMTGLIGKRSRMRLSATGTTTGRETIDSVEIQGMRRGGAFREAQRFHGFPDTAVSVGSSWQTKVVDTTNVMGQKMQTTIAATYTLNGTEQIGGAECLRIGYKGESGVEGKGANMGMEMYIEGKGALAGSFLFDPRRGIVVSEDMKTDMEMTIAISGQQNMTIPSTQSVTYTRKLISN
jgi:hypothetical protein